MSADRQTTTTEAWMPWEGKLVNGDYPLRRLLGGSNHSGVFLTEQRTDSRPDVAIKFIPADTVQAEAQLVQWGAATALSHPNLVRIFDVGRYRAGGREYLFVVMEHADQTLAEILPRRPLVAEEVKELLLPTLDTLLFLHRKGLLHGRLKPSNFLAVNDRLKLTSDSIRPINHVASGAARTSAYDPPELKDRALNAAGDMWGLGMTLLEALTQRTTAWPDETISVPAHLPEPFASIIAKCLNSSPAARPNALDLDAQLRPGSRPPPPPPTSPAPKPAPQPSAPPAPKAPPVQTPPPPLKPAPKPAPAKSPSSKRPAWQRGLMIVLPFAVVAWLIVHFYGGKQTPPRPPAVPIPAATPATPPAAATPAAMPEEPKTATQASPARGDVVQEVLPKVPNSALNRIRGRIHVTVRVLVDQQGDVMGAMLEDAGTSAYLAGHAERAAEDWKFAPAAKKNSRVWMILFVFTRDGVKARATPQ